MAFNQINQKNVKLQMKQSFAGVLQNSDRKKILQKKKRKRRQNLPENNCVGVSF